jgi:hypothetical protein
MAQRSCFAMLLALCVAGAGCAFGQATNSPGDAANGKRIHGGRLLPVSRHRRLGQPPDGAAHRARPDALRGVVGLVRHPRNIMPPYTTMVLSDQQLTDIYATSRSHP